MLYDGLSVYTEHKRNNVHGKEDSSVLSSISQHDT